jgi:hypothetical protein
MVVEIVCVIFNSNVGCVMMIWVINSNTPGSLKFLFFLFLCLDFVSDWIWAARWGLSCSGQHPFKVKIQIPFKPFVLNVGSSFKNISTNTKFRYVVAGGVVSEFFSSSYFFGHHLWSQLCFYAFSCLLLIIRFSFVKMATFFKLLHHLESALFSIATKTSILKSLLPLVLHA